LYNKHVAFFVLPLEWLQVRPTSDFRWDFLFDTTAKTASVAVKEQHPLRGVFSVSSDAGELTL
jgi:hypothetical protein